MKSTPGLRYIWLCLGITITLFILSKIISGAGVVYSWIFLSQLFSLLGITLLSLTFILSGRWRLLEDWFGGLDKVYKVHHLLGGTAFVFILHHPLFLVFNTLPFRNSAWQYLWFSYFWPYNWGLSALYTLTLILICTLILNLPYSLWKKIHEFMGLVLLFASLHVITISSDISWFLPLRYWIFFLLILASASVIYRRFLYGFIGPKYSYFVKNIRKIENIVILELIPGHQKLAFNPGQFVFTRFSDLGSESHPFSLSGSPEDPGLTISAKVLGDYTGRLKELKLGSLVTLWGPYGKFGEGAMGEKDLLWIAGGIGVTPFLSLLASEVAHPKSRKINFLYCVSRQKEAIFDQKIKSLVSKNPNIKYLKYVSDLSGRLDIRKIINLTGGVGHKRIMICGPASMMDSLTTQFKSAGVRNKDLFFEDFNLK